jgi:hypothetical protein
LFKRFFSRRAPMMRQWMRHKAPHQHRVPARGSVRARQAADIAAAEADLRDRGYLLEALAWSEDPPAGQVEDRFLAFIELDTGRKARADGLDHLGAGIGRFLTHRKPS